MSMVITHIRGGLGNQMFQFAAGRALAYRCGATLKLDISSLPEAGRSYALGPMAIQADAVTVADLDRLDDNPHGGEHRFAAVKRSLQRLRRSGALRFYSQPHFHFDPIVPTLRPPVHLSGYWISEKYFADCAELVRRELSAREPLDPQNTALAAQIDAVNAVSLHVRRGDYVTDPDVRGRFVACSPAYYRRALEHIEARAPAPHIFVFSDDPAWTRDNLRLDRPTTFVDVNPPERGDRDVHLMSRCRHHIIANSTFSWWGAWLNPSPDKIVVAPARWFEEWVPRDTRDLIPERWIKL